MITFWKENHILEGLTKIEKKILFNKRKMVDTFHFHLFSQIIFLILFVWIEIVDYFNMSISKYLSGHKKEKRREKIKSLFNPIY